MITFTSPEVVAALMAERHREIAERARGQAVRRALACCRAAVTRLRRPSFGRRPAAC